MRLLVPALLLLHSAAAVAAPPPAGPVVGMPTLSTAIILPKHTVLPPASPLWLENMTWPEVRDAVKAGKTTIIVPTGGTEQNGPALALGKHNFILRYTAMTIATTLGDALVTPIMPYVPEGSINPPAGHMRFAGTLSLSPETFKGFLEDTARSLKQHGFKTICFVGEHGASQQPQKEVAEKLTEEWKDEGVKVIHVNEYYDEHNGQNDWLTSQHVEVTDPQAHGGLADTAEMLAVYPAGIRNGLLKAYTPADEGSTGASGDGTKASWVIGSGLLQHKIDAAVKQIERERKGK